MAQTEYLADHATLRALNETYADAVFRRDAEAWGGTWALDATWDLAGNVFTGRPAIVTAWNGAMAQYPFVAFFCQPGHFQVSGDDAEGRVYTSEVLVNQAGETQRVIGVYADRYVRRGGVWLYARRVYTMLKAH